MDRYTEDAYEEPEPKREDGSDTLLALLFIALVAAVSCVTGGAIVALVNKVIG